MQSSVRHLPDLGLTRQSSPRGQSYGDTSFYDQVARCFYNEPIRARVANKLEEQGYAPMSMVGTIDAEEHEELLKYGAEGRQEILNLLGNIFNGAHLKQSVFRKLSPGVSTRDAPYVLLLQRILSSSKKDLDANYTGPNGPDLAISAIRTLEGELLGDREAYPENGIFFVTGGSNGIHNIIEYFGRIQDGKNSIVGCGPVYQQVLRNTNLAKVPINVLAHPSVQPDSTGVIRFLPTSGAIKRAVIESNAGALVVTQPNGATGEFYSKSELAEIVQIAEKFGLIIFEDAVYEELPFPEHKGVEATDPFHSVAQVAHEMGQLHRVATIKSFSKGKNLPGSRIGMVITKNPSLINFLSERLHAQRDFEGGLFNDMVCLDAILRLIEHRCQKQSHKKNLSELIEVTKEIFGEKICERIDVPLNTSNVMSYISQRVADMQAYLGSYEFLKSHEVFKAVSETRAAFNTLLLLPNHKRPTEYLAQSLFVNRGVEAEWGPNFGIRTEAGLWVRGTFSSSPEYLADSISRTKKELDGKN